MFLKFVSLLIIILIPATLFAVENDVPDFSRQKRHQFEFVPYGGSYLGSTVGQTWQTGARLYFFFNSSFAIGASYGYSRLLTDRSSTFGRSLNNTNMHLADFEVVLSNDAVFRAGESLIEFDLYGTLGVGGIMINAAWEPVGLIGGGIKVYPGLSWLAIRIDVNNYLHYTKKPGNDPFDADVAFLGAVSFMFPVKAAGAL